MKVINNHNLPVPMALDCNRNAVLMDYIDGDLLAKMDFNDSAVDIDDLFQQCLDFLIELSSLSLVHGDFNEFNIMVKDKRKIVVIDFPQTLSVYSDQAERIYERDLNSVVTFFEKQGATPKELPQFNEIQVKERCDIITKATGYENSDFLAQYTIENLKLKPEITNGINEFFESDDEVNNLDDGGNEAPHLPETQVDSSSKNSGDWIEKRVKHEFRIKRVKNEQRQTRHHQINSQKRKIRHMTKTFS
ncbi:MAG: Serine/threonine-protein kinase RIO2 [Marteilia pararefringens]